MNFRPTKLIPLAILVLSVNIPSAWSQSAKEKVDLLVTGGTVVTMNEGRAILDDGATDSLTGGAGLDWFFQSAGDQLPDFNSAAERLTTV